MDCKKALTETNGDYDAAVEALRKKGASVAAKRAENATNNGTIHALISPDYSAGALVVVSCETDFSANTTDMATFAGSVAQNVLAHGTADASTPESIEALMLQKQVTRPELTLQASLNELISKIAEKITVSRYARYADTKNVINAYVHPGSNLGVMVEVAVDKRPADITALVTAARDIAMQVAVTNPLCIIPEELDTNVVEKEKEIYKEQLRAEGKSEQMLDKIVLGKMAKYYESVCLNRQIFIKNDKENIGQMLDAVSKKSGCTATIKRFTRFSIGG